MSDGSSGTVKLVFSMQDEELFKSILDLGVGGELVLGTVHHLQEVFDVSKFKVSGKGLFTFVNTVASSGNRGSYSKDSVDVDVSFLLGAIDILTNEGWVSLGVEGRES